MKIIFTLSHLLIPLLVHTQSLIHLKSDVPNGGEITIRLPLNKHRVKFEVDLYFPRSIIDSASFMSDNKETLSVDETPITFLDRFRSEYEFQQCTGNFKIKDTCNIDFYFYAPLNNSYTEVSNTLSFAYKFTDTKHSIVHQLYKSGHIPKKQFAFQSEIHNTSNLFSIGGVPPEYIEGKNKATLYVDQSHNSWGFEVTAIKYNSTISKYFNKQHAYVFTNDTDFFVDNETFNWFKTEVFGELLNDGSCKMCKFGKRKTICCTSETYLNIEPFSFVIQGYQFNFNKNEMFYCDNKEDTCYFIVQVMSPTFCVVDESWKIGFTFLEKFVSVFDYDDSSISFYYSGDNVIYTGEGVNGFINNAKGKKVLLGIEIVLLCGCVLMLGVFMIRLKKNGSVVGDITV